LAAGAVASGASWPTYRHDAARSSITQEELTLPLTPQWLFEAGTAPARGWAEPARGEVWEYGIERRRKAAYDDAPALAVGAGMVFFNLSGEERLAALDAASGTLRWSYATGAPARLGPTLAEERVYFGDDAGTVHALHAGDGRVAWTFNAAPARDRVIGHGRVMSVWPIRTGVLVQDGTAYFGSGLFPSEGVRLYALCAETGRSRWINEDAADGADLSPQGYLLADPQRLILPSGRTTPAVFDRADGRRPFRLGGGRGLAGGSEAMLAGNLLLNGSGVLTGYDLDAVGRDRWNRPIHGPSAFEWFEAGRAVVAGGTAYVSTDRELIALPIDRMTEAAQAADALRRVRWDQRNALRAYRQAAAVLETLEPGTALHQRRTQEVERYRPQAETVAAAERAHEAALDVLCRWRVPCDANAALILAGSLLFAGGEGRVLAYDAGSGALRWQGAVPGTARDLAVAEGRLVVATTTGAVAAFAPGDVAGAGPPVRHTAPPVRRRPYADDARLQAQLALADRVVAESNIDRGFALLVDSDEGRLAWALAQATELHMYVVEPDAASARRARNALTAAGLHGSRVRVEHNDGRPLSHPPYFANLVIWRRGLAGAATAADGVRRVLRPHGGVAWLAGPAGGPNTWPAPGFEVRRDGEWTIVRRGPLDGEGEWTHLYADAGNTGGSGDRQTALPLGALWFGDPGPADMIDRHARGMAPLSAGGRLFVAGHNVLIAVDAYNGLELWRRELSPGGRTHVHLMGGNLALSPGGLFIALDDRTLRLDPATGETLATYELPAREDGEQRRWGWIAVQGDTLFGSRTDRAAPPRHWPEFTGHTSEAVFALDVESGTVRWIQEGLAIMHTAIAIDGGTVFYVDGQVTDEERIGARDEFAEAGEPPSPPPTGQPPTGRRGEPIPPDVRRVVAADARSGVVRWTRPIDVTECVVHPKGNAAAGGEVNVIARHGVVLLCGSPWNGHFMQEWQAGRFSRRSLIALDAADGRLLWSGFKGYRSRPILIGERIFAEPWAHDLRTGRQHMQPNPETGEEEPWQIWRGYGHCGPAVASANTVLFRIAPLGFYDLRGREGLAWFDGLRPSCHVNFIAAGGLVLVPEGSAMCDCPYPIQASLALVPRSLRTPDASEP
jgi:outer membrane protein assembly factor BamB